MSTGRREYARFAKIPTDTKMPRQHKFAIGQMVQYYAAAGPRLPRIRDKAARENDFEIVRLLPAESADFQYRIKNARNGQERIVAESEITLADFP
jgi:hypothetical protein